MGGVLRVALGMELEVRGAGAALGEPIALHQPAELRRRDGRLAGLDRVERDEPFERVARGGPGLDALLGLGKRVRVRRRAELASEVVPEGNVVALLGCV